MSETDAFLITFTTYGSWLPGDARGSSERLIRSGSTVSIEPNPDRMRRAQDKMREQPMTLGVRMRPIVAAAITEVCTNRGWSLLASNVRTNHVHVVVAGPDNPVAAMTAFKAWSTRRLREEGLIPNRDRVWTRHGSTRFLYTVRAVAAAVAYVVEGQGDDLGGTVPPQSELL